MLLMANANAIEQAFGAVRLRGGLLNRRDIGYFAGCPLGGALGDALGATIETKRLA